MKPFVVTEGPSTSREGTGYRLPTEAEWEFACRAGTTTKFWNGNTDDDLMRSGWFRTTQIERSRNVGELASNPFGLFDVHGNVAEWVHDAWNPTYYAQFADQPAIDPIGPTVPGDYRVTRGGVWHFRAPFCRSASRYSVPVNYNDPSTGFRTAISVDGVVQAVAQRASSLSAGD